MKFLKLIISIIIISSCTTVEDDNNFSFSPEALPGMTIYGIIAEENGESILFITKVRLFSNWEGGWTEGFYEASGKYFIESNTDKYKLTQIDPFELWDITFGEIRYHDTYYRGDDGLWKVKNRVDRLKEISRVLIDELGQDEFSNDLSLNIYPFLFPELYKSLKSFNTDLEPEIIKSSGIKWRSDYTKTVFPKQIWPLRDSGTLYRDVQEAPEIFRSIYNLKSYFRNKELEI